jgi:hypothetical protein
MVKAFILSPRGNKDSNDDGSHNHNAPKHHESHSEEQLLKLSYLTNGRFRWSIEGDDRGAELEIGTRSILRT